MADAPPSRFRKLFEAVHAFVMEKGIEAHEEKHASRLHRFAHYWLLVLKSFDRNKCFLRATALAYTTLLALVPLFALTVSITTALLQEKGKEATQEMIAKFVDAAVPQLKLVPKTPGQTVDARTEVVQNIHLFIANVESKTLGVTGMVGLVVVAIMLLGTIENTFNEIWGVPRGRNWLRRVAQYWAVISLGPILLAVAGGLLSSSYLASSQDFQRASPWLANLAFKAVPFVVVSIGFALLYKVIPNTPVHWSAALIGGAMGGCLWVLVNLFNALNASRVMGMSKIYGTAMGLMPIFLVGLYFSWVILLFGAQVAYSHQNRQVYLQERKAEAVNQRGREFVALRLMAHLASLYARQEPPPPRSPLLPTSACPAD
jgi:membrane protein